MWRKLCREYVLWSGVIDFSTLQYVVTKTRPEDLTEALHAIQFTRFIPLTPLVRYEQKGRSTPSPVPTGEVSQIRSMPFRSRAGWGLAMSIPGA